MPRVTDRRPFAWGGTMPWVCGMLWCVSTPDLEQNKANVIAFYDLMFNQCRPAEAIARYVVVCEEPRRP
jgi:hypothetical protein